MASVPPRQPDDDSLDEQPVAIPRKKGVADEDMDITPMIDITFLLLIFFLVASKMTAEQAVDLPKARHGGAIAATEAVIILVRKGSGETAQVLRNDGSEFSSGDLSAQEDEILAYVEAGINGTAPFDQPKKMVLIKAEGGVKAGDVSRVKEAAEKVLTEQRLYVGVLDAK